MKAVIIDDEAGERRMMVRDVPAPTPGPTELLVRVAAAGLNRAELVGARASGHAAHPLGIGGGEMAGVVVALGDQCEDFAVGDRVMGLTTGSYAELTTIDYRLAIPVPDAIDITTAASLPAWFMTAHNALLTEGQLQPDEAVVIQGATSGVGIAAARLARHFGARIVIGIARSKDKLERLVGQGIDAAVVAEPGWVDRTREATGGEGADLIIDMVGQGALGGNLESAALRGRIIAVGRLGGQTDQIDINLLAMKRLRLIGVSFRTRTVAEKALIARRFAVDVLPAIADGSIAPFVDSLFPLSEIAAAHEHVRRNAHLGKILLEMR